MNNKIPTCLAVLSGKSRFAVADIAVHTIAAGSFILTRIWPTFVDIYLQSVGVCISSMKVTLSLMQGFIIRDVIYLLYSHVFPKVSCFHEEMKPTNLGKFDKEFSVILTEVILSQRGPFEWTK